MCATGPTRNADLLGTGGNPEQAIWNFFHDGPFSARVSKLSTFAKKYAPVTGARLKAI
jgi:hypothetical protein